jgi:Transglutaminase-like superfamily
MGRLRSFFRLRAGDRLLLLEAVILLPVARVLVHTVGFERFATRLGSHMAQSSDEDSTEAYATARRVRWAVETAARNLPFEVICLPQAIAGKLMLRRRGIASTLYLGVAYDPALKAHAWLRVGRVIVTGAKGRVGFSVVSTFA